MDSTSQTSADDIINEYRSCSCCTFSYIVGSAKDFVNKLKDQVKKKEKHLPGKKQANEELLANVKKAGAVQATPGTEELKRELAIAQKTNSALQMAFWKSFPSPHLCYSIKAPSIGYLYDDNSDCFCASTGDHPKEYFKFTKDASGAFTICPKSKIQEYEKSASNSVIHKFVLIFHPQQDKQQAGIFVDIFVLAENRFMFPEVNHQNQLMAKSPTAPSKKFLILAEGVE